MENENDAFWKGTHISEFQTNFNLPQFPGLVNGDDHVVLVQTPIIVGKVPNCFPSIFDKIDIWDQDHVKLPCSERNVTEDQISRWGLIREAISSVILSGQQLETAILSYNKRFAERWNFATLRAFFDEVCEEEETAMFFQSLFPKIVDLALCLPELITAGIPLLKHGRKNSVSLSQMQIASLLANAFFCTFPHRNSYAKGCEYANYPTINFTRLFQAVFRDRTKPTYEKLRCLLHYFRRVTSSTPTGVVTYSRNFVPNLLIPNWSESSKKLTKLYVSSKGTIEDDGFGLLQVDFAHKLVGGGVIANGCVQEEIRFIVCPELILSRLFTECLDDNEALVVTGCERFSKYTGYGKSFEWDGDYVDETPSDEEGRKYCSIIAIDALFFKRNANEQYLPQKFTRELNKAYAGFSWGSRVKREELCGVATGNWGCGVYRGNVELKSLLQLMVAAECNRDLAYFTFADDELRDSMHSIHHFLTDNNITVGKIYNLLCQYNASELYNSTTTIYEYVRREALNDDIAAEKASENSNNVATKVIKPMRIPQFKPSLFDYRKKKTADLNKTPQEDKPNTQRNNVDDSDKESTPQPSKQIDDAQTREMKKKETDMFLKMYASKPSSSFADDSDDSFDLDKYRKVKRICTEIRAKPTLENTDSIVQPEPMENVEVTVPTKHIENHEHTMQTEPFDGIKITPHESVEDETEAVNKLDLENNLDEQIHDENETHTQNEDTLENKSIVNDNCVISNHESREESDSTEIIHKSPVHTPGRPKSIPLSGLKFIKKKAKRKNISKKKPPHQNRKISEYFSLQKE